MTSRHFVDQKSKKKMGRPATGQLPAISARVSEEVLERVDEWAEANQCTRSIAVAKLLEHGLDAIKPRRRSARLFSVRE